MADHIDRDARVQEIDRLVRSLESTQDAGLRRTAQELVQALMDLHGVAIARMLEISDTASAAGAPLIDAFGQDEVVRHLLLLHGLHPLDLRTRVRQALEQTRPYLMSHGGNVELVDINASGVVTIRLLGSCQSCPSSSITLKTAVEEALLESAPDITSLVVEGIEETPDAAATVGFVPLASLQSHPPRAMSMSTEPMQPALQQGGD